MILSNTKIQDALDNGHFVINPLPRRVTEDQNPFNTSSIDLRLGNEISEFERGAGLNIDLTQGNFRQLFAQNSKKHKLLPDQPFLLQPNRMVLGTTLEKIDLPINSHSCLAARVEGRSSYARCGLLVHFTAPTIHAGFKGTIALELINLGPIPINLHENMPICQLILERVEGQPMRMDSQFQGQTTVAGA